MIVLKVTGSTKKRENWSR